jgi:hypothetical protein
MKKTYTFKNSLELKDRLSLVESLKSNGFKFARLENATSIRFMINEESTIIDTYKGKIHPKHTNPAGYILAKLEIGWNRSINVHRIMGFTFLDKPDGKTEINHKDFNKANNHISNLEWCTKQENMAHYAATMVGRVLECPHCGKKSVVKDDRIMRRWHFDNCRTKNATKLF